MVHPQSGGGSEKQLPPECVASSLAEFHQAYDADPQSTLLVDAGPLEEPSYDSTFAGDAAVGRLVDRTGFAVVVEFG